MQDIKEKLIKDMENLRKKNQTEILEIKVLLFKQKTVEGHSSRFEQGEDRLSDLKDKISVKEKNGRTLSQTN
jgi:hypothetical protein